jgi:uncharacterized HAD superfamily protein
MKHARVIGFDFDDVIVATNKAMMEWHNRVYGTSYRLEDVYTCELDKIWSCSYEERTRRIDEFFTSIEHSTTSAIDAAVKSLELLQDKEVHIITARRKEYSNITLALAERHISSLFNNFHFPNGGEIDGIPVKRSKAEVCLECGIEVFIDDNLEYALNVASVGIPVLLLDAPWNQVAGQLPQGIERVFSWGEIVRKLT